MDDNTEKIEIHRGLKGVYFDRSPCTYIDGKAGELRYRGYSIHDLAQHSTFEETAWLLLHGELPAKSELAGFDQELRAARELPGQGGRLAEQAVVAAQDRLSGRRREAGRGAEAATGGGRLAGAAHAAGAACAS